MLAVCRPNIQSINKDPTAIDSVVNIKHSGNAKQDTWIKNKKK